MSTNKKVSTHLRQTFLGFTGTNDKNSATIDQRLNQGLEKMNAQLVRANRVSLEIFQRLQYTIGKLVNNDQAKLTFDSLRSNIKTALERNNLFSNKVKPSNPEPDNSPRMGRK